MVYVPIKIPVGNVHAALDIFHLINFPQVIKKLANIHVVKRHKIEKYRNGN